MAFETQLKSLKTVQLGMLVIISSVNDKVGDVMMLGVTGETIFTLESIRR